MDTTVVLNLAAASAGLLAARLVIGLLMAAHGAQKLFGWFGGYGIAGTAGFFESIGFRPGRLFAIAAAVTEFGSGLLITLGLLGPVGPALMISVMIVAMISVHWQNGVFATKNGIELTLLFAVAGFALGLTGPGLYSLDTLLGIDGLWSAKLDWIVLALGIVGGLANLAARRPTPPTRTA
jgi:putative oxidoreductase